MKKIYPNTSYRQEILKHRNLPIFCLKEFNFYRIIEFKTEFYKKTVSELHGNNLREPIVNNRYSNLFDLGKVSYWSSDENTAKKEFIFHNNEAKNFIIFHSYDDFTSTIPIMDINENLIIVDGTKLLGFSEILEKYENNIEFTNKEKELINKIEKFNPDCIAYNSKRNPIGVNYMFFEKGFKKLALKEIKLKIKIKNTTHQNQIICAHSSDYLPLIKNYGYYFDSIAKVKFNEKYLNTSEYMKRKEIYDLTYKKILG